MSWIKNFVRPKIRKIVAQKKDVPDNLWTKCAGCEAMIFHADYTAKARVCPQCGHHHRMPPEERCALLFDKDSWNMIELPRAPIDPLRFKDRRKYAERLREAQRQTGHDDAVQVAFGTIAGQGAVIAVFDFNFMGGSMGVAAGEAIVTAARLAGLQKSALILVPSSGGARMQEGMLSLMQMPRTVAAVLQHKEMGLPYIVLLTDPTTGGVSASFAMLGDVHIAEPGAMIGFAGKRVIEQTIREELPEGFQTAEALYRQGAVDMVVPRDALRECIGNLLTLLMQPRIDSAA